MDDNIEQLQKLQGKIIRLSFDKQRDVELFFNDLKNFALQLQHEYLIRGYDISLSKEMTISFLTSIAKVRHLLLKEADFEDGKKEISKILISLQKELA